MIINHMHVETSSVSRYFGCFSKTRRKTTMIAVYFLILIFDLVLPDIPAKPIMRLNVKNQMLF